MPEDALPRQRPLTIPDPGTPPGQIAPRGMRRDLSRFRARGVSCAQQLDERAMEFLRA
ncbi:hypothetical protein [Nonomuraea sp. NPDC049695]|uniref:hypothetical protein n=1 Tax=Nonomuraea sp. NPDC049695 TaxID=3154734 RepID=UPI0034435612